MASPTRFDRGYNLLRRNARVISRKPGRTSYPEPRGAPVQPLKAAKALVWAGDAASEREVPNMFASLVWGGCAVAQSDNAIGPDPRSRRRNFLCLRASLFLFKWRVV